MMKEKGFALIFSHQTPLIVLVGAMVLASAGFAWGKSPVPYPPYPAQGYAKQATPPGVEVGRRQQGSPQTDEDLRRNWKTYQGLSPDDKAGLREKSQRWQSLPPEERQEMRRRMDQYRELPPQDQERYQKRYQQWQSLPPEDRNRIRDRLRNWDSLSPQEQDDVRRRFQKR